MSEAPVICEKRGAAGFILLNRPRALNALTPDMVAGMAIALDRWENDDAVARVVVVSGAGERAFCAGGDIRLMHDLGRAGDHASQLAFWRDEYRLNRRIARYPKPYVSLIDGIVMGGGVGISIHGTYRVASERFSFAMPEVAIGFFPDVGASYILSRLPGAIGTYLALSGARIGAGDAMELGIATHSVASSRIPDLSRALEGRGDTGEILSTWQTLPPPSALAANRSEIEHLFSAQSLARIDANVDAAAAAGSAFAEQLRQTLQRVSPTSRAIALRQLQEGRALGLEACLQLDFRIVSRICKAADFYEGVRALLIDKDQRPNWQPALTSGLAPDATDAYFAPLRDGELPFGMEISA